MSETVLEKKAGFPKGIPYIIATEVAERFSFYGMSGILPIFLVDQFFNPHAVAGLQTVAEAKSNELTHLFVTLAYFVPLIGGILADWFFGKYKVILYVAFLYCAGHLMLALFDTQLNLFECGIIFIAIGAGGIKSNVSAILGDQMTRNNEHLMSKVFGWYYFGVNTGSVLATISIPVVYKYYGAKWAFGIPGVFMALAALVFFLGRNRYKQVSPSGIRKDNFIAVLFFMIKASFTKVAGQTIVQRTKKQFSSESLDGLFAVKRLLSVLVFIPIFWAMWYQSLSEWVLQAGKLDLHFMGQVLLPAQVQSFNPFFILATIPAFTYGLYPFLEKIGIRCTPLRKIGAGLFFCLLSFCIIALLQGQIDQGQHPTVWWQIIAYLLLTFSEVLVSVTFLEYAYTQSPPKLKSTMTAIWWLTLAAGNLFTALVNRSISNKGLFSYFTGARYYWLFVIIMSVFLVLYMLISPTIKEKTYLVQA